MSIHKTAWQVDSMTCKGSVNDEGKEAPWTLAARSDADSTGVIITESDNWPKN